MINSWLIWYYEWIVILLEASWSTLLDVGSICIEYENFEYVTKSFEFCLYFGRLLDLRLAVWFFKWMIYAWFTLLHGCVRQMCSALAREAHKLSWADGSKKTEHVKKVLHHFVTMFLGPPVVKGYPSICKFKFSIFGLMK